MADSIVYQGFDFSEWTTAEVTMMGAHGLNVQTEVVPGRDGDVVTAWSLTRFPIRVKLMLRPEARMADAELSDMRRRMRNALCPQCTDPTIVLPEEPHLEWHEVYLENANALTSLFEDGEAEFEFICHNPYAWGETRAVKDEEFEVGGDGMTVPEIRLIAKAGSSVKVSQQTTGRYVLVNHEFAGGELVVVDCDYLSVTINGKRANADVDLSSDFFEFEPGTEKISAVGTSDFTVYFTERWI